MCQTKKIYTVKNCLIRCVKMSLIPQCAFDVNLCSVGAHPWNICVLSTKVKFTAYKHL